MEDNGNGNKVNKEQTDFNNLYNLFKEYKNSLSKNYSRLLSISFSDENANNFRKDFYDFDINEDEEFSKYIIKRLDILKENFIYQFDENVKKIERIFEEFKNRISSFITSKERKLFDAKNSLNNRH